MYLVSARAHPARLLLMLSSLAVIVVLLMLAVPPAHALTLARAADVGALHVSPLLALAALGTSAVDTTPFVLPAAMQGKQLEAWFQTLVWNPINAGLGVPQVTVANPNFDVVIHRLAYTARNPATLALVDRPLLSADFSTASNWIYNPNGNPVELENLAGVNRGSPDLWVPLSIPAGETLTVTLTNSEAVNLRVALTLIGLRSAKQKR